MIVQAPTALYEVAILSAGYDARSVRQFAERLGARLWAGGDTPVWTADVERGAHPGGTGDVLDHASRLVVVLHDRMWGRTPATAADVAAVKRRLEREGAAFLRFVLLDDTAPPAWGRGADARSLPEAGIDALIEWLVDAVQAEGGSARSSVAADVTARAAADERRARERDAFLGSARAAPACMREFDDLAEEIARRATALEDTAGTKADVRRAPGRCILQLGPVALTLSWMRARFDLVSEGRLLIIEWRGTVGRGAERVPERAPDRRAGMSAVVIREDVFVADATGAEDWLWRREGTPSGGYASRELAALCADSLLSTLEQCRQ